MKNKIKKIDDKWWWPKDDGISKKDGTESDQSCWNYMQLQPDLALLVSKHVENKNVVVQAGGNCGFYVKQYAELFQTVYTFEPDPVNFYCLNLNVTEENVFKYQACIGESHGTVGLDNFMSDVGATHVKGEGRVPVLLIDDLNLTSCDLIHLDIEGFEIFALRGARKTIETFKPVICFEHHDAWSARYEYGLNELENEIFRFGYKFIGRAHNDKIYKVC